MYDVFYADCSFDRARSDLPRRAESGAYAISLWDGSVLLARRGKWVAAASVPARFAVGQRVRWGSQIVRIAELQAATATVDCGRGIVAAVHQALLRRA